ncbi:MAG: hypothetical protein RLZZ416_534 [Candidatus Parcubacteria bacterium]|jgi:ABC-type multidrug transport system fused ATPase/permease subunit
MRLSRTLLSRYRTHLVLLVGLGFLSGTLEGVGITAIIPLFSYFLGQQIPGGNKIVGFVVGVFNYLPVKYSPLSLLVFVIILFILRALVLVVFYYLRARISSSYMVRTMNDLWDKVLRAKWAYLLQQRLGTIDVTISRDVRMGQSLLENISQAVLVFTNLAIYVALALYISFPVTVATAVAGAALLLLLRPLRGRIKQNSRNVSAAEKNISHFLNEHTLGLKMVKSAAVEPAVYRAGLSRFDSLKQLIMQTALFSSVGMAITQPIALIFMTGVFLFFYGKATLELGSFVALIYLIQKIFTYVESGQAALHSIQDRLAYAEHAAIFADTLAGAVEPRGGGTPFHFEHSLAFSNVSFSYDGRTTVLDGVSFSLQKGGLAGLIGPSGAGKTSVADLLLRLFEPTSGALLLDGKDSREFYIASWRRSIGYVSQDMFLVNDTVANNIRFYNPELGDDAVREAARMANCIKFVERLPHGFDEVIGERGIMLSVGQRQRIVLARVLARKPEILILDEATSALDNESEQLVQEAIEGLKKKITVLIIAHRLSTVMGADELFVIQDGHIKEQGAPKDLLANPESYFSRMNTK